MAAMSDVALVARQVTYENRAFWRNPPAAFFTFVFPLIFLVLFNLLFGNVYRFTTTVGARVFDVAIEGDVVLNDFDQVAAAGGSGLMINRAILVDVTDGNGIQIEFIRGVQNPSVKGIEVLTRTD